MTAPVVWSCSLLARCSLPSARSAHVSTCAVPSGATATSLQWDGDKFSRNQLLFFVLDATILFRSRRIDVDATACQACLQRAPCGSVVGVEVGMHGGRGTGTSSANLRDSDAMVFSPGSARSVQRQLRLKADGRSYHATWRGDMWMSQIHGTLRLL